VAERHELHGGRDLGFAPGPGIAGAGVLGRDRPVDGRDGERARERQAGLGDFRAQIREQLRERAAHGEVLESQLGRLAPCFERTA
jgi:hypothetical protein